MVDTRNAEWLRVASYRYLDGAVELCRSDGRNHSFPVLMLSAHAFELWLKSKLLENGTATTTDLAGKNYGHNLEKMWNMGDFDSKRKDAEVCYAVALGGTIPAGDSFAGRVGQVSAIWTRETDYTLRYPISGFFSPDPCSWTAALECLIR
jgi:hypothetical protein